MDRKKLVDTLTVVSAAIERNNVIPIYEWFCFTGKEVFAWNDEFGIVAPCEMPEAFAVQGTNFLAWLKASEVGSVDIQIEDGTMLATAGSANFNPPIQSPSDFVWHEPSLDNSDEIDIFEGIQKCLVTASDNLALGEYSKVHIGSSKGKITIYSTDGDGFTKYTTDIYGNINICVEKGWCNVVAKTGSGKFKMNGEWVCWLSEGCKIYGRNLGEAQFDYESTISEILGGEIPELVPIPPEFDAALSRARVVADIETSPTNLTVKKNVLSLITETAFGDVFDDVAVKHPNVAANVSAELVQTNMKDCTEFKILENCCVFRGEKVLRLISNLEAEK